MIISSRFSILFFIFTALNTGCGNERSPRESALTCLSTCEPKLAACSLDAANTDAACAAICADGLSASQKSCLESAECNTIIDAVNQQAEFCGITALVSDGTDGTDGSDGSDGMVEPQKCTTSDDCTNTQLCDCLGRCVEPGLADIASCTEDKNCGSGNYCDVCSGVCRVKKSLCEPCEGDNECLDDGACRDFASGGRYCLRACVSNIGCPQPGFSCIAVEGDSLSQCVPDDGICVEPTVCQADSDCELGTICEQGRCRPGCTSDDVCPTTNVCQMFRCVEACSATVPCPDGQECAADGHCRIPGGCIQPADCLEPETYCDQTTNTCTPGCLADYDCKSSAKECIDGKCETKGCSANFYCAFGEVCALETGKCEPAPGPHCEANCDPQSQSACGGQPNRCLELQDDEGNSKGAFCFVACGADPNNACPQGYACQELQNQDGAVEAQLCFRDCANNPVAGQK